MENSNLENTQEFSDQKQQSTSGFLFTKDYIATTPDLQPVHRFLSEIEEELNALFDNEENIQAFADHYEELLKILEERTRLLEEHNIEYSGSTTETPSVIIARLNNCRPVTTSKMITIFAALETFFAIKIAYDYETSDEKEIRKKAGNSDLKEEFINTYCLNNRNSWIKENPEKANRLDVKLFIELRNFLTHFFSVISNISITESDSEKQLVESEKFQEVDMPIITPENLKEIFMNAALLIFKEWSDDYKKNPEEFDGKIQSVLRIIERRGQIKVRLKDLNL